MNFEDIKNMDIERLQIVPMEVGRNDPNLKDKLIWEDQLNPHMKEFKIDHSRKALSSGKIVIPVFTEAELVPISYEDRFGNLYKSKGNYVYYRVEYDFGHLIKISQNFYIRTLKISDEKFPQDHQLRENTKELHFKYEFNKEGFGQWRYVEDYVSWQQQRQELDKIKNEKEKEIGKTFSKYYRYYREIKDSMPPNQFEDIQALFYFYNNLLNSTVEYYEMKKEINDISNKNFKLIRSEIVKVKAEIEKKEHIATLDSIEFFKRREMLIDSNSLIKKLFSPGYWVHCDKIYPNAGELFELTQLATTNRNVNSKYLLKKALLKTAKGKKTFISLDNTLLKNTLKTI